MTQPANAIDAALDAAMDHAAAEAKARKRRTPIPHEIPRDLWEPPAGTLEADAPLDDYMTVVELTAALVENGGTVWRWLHQMGRVPFYELKGSRSHYVRRADAQPWIDEINALPPDRRKRALRIDKNMRRRRLEELAKRLPPREAEVHQHPVAEQLGFDIPERGEPPPVRRTIYDEGDLFRPLPWIQAVYGVKFHAVLAAIKLGELAANVFDGHYHVRHRDLLDWFERTRYRP
jgi:hypothetical protein